MKTHARPPMFYELKRALSRPALLSAIAIIALALWTTSCKNDESLSTQPATVTGIMTRADMAARFSDAAWSTPVNVGRTVVNSPSRDQSPFLSKDGLSLYFSSGRTGGFGGNDLYVSHRASEESAFEAPVNLGSVVNGMANEAGPFISRDGHLLFFNSTRTGANDIYMATREHTHDDFAWGAPVLLGPDINTAAVEASPYFMPGDDDSESEDVGGAEWGQLYFERAVLLPGRLRSREHIFVATISRDGTVLEAPVLIDELVGPDFDAHVTIRKDGKELYMMSEGRPGGQGALNALDIWVSTRQSRNEPWSTPVNAGPVINGPRNDIHPSLSHDGATLVFASMNHDPVRGLTDLDIFISTRRR